jgi:hypothetical protein
MNDNLSLLLYMLTAGVTVASFLTLIGSASGALLYLCLSVLVFTSCSSCYMTMKANSLTQKEEQVTELLQATKELKRR